MRQGYSARGCQQTLQELQPRGDTQTYYQLVAIALLLLKVKYEECLINILAERVQKGTQPPNVLLTYEPLHRCLWGLTDAHLERSQGTFTWHHCTPSHKISTGPVPAVEHTVRGQQSLELTGRPYLLKTLFHFLKLHH